MRQCGLCQRTLRWDETLRTVQVCQDNVPGMQFLVSLWGTVEEATVGAQACETCAAQLNGQQPPSPRRYPAGKPIPLHPDPVRARRGEHLPLCGLCRLALPEDEEVGRPIRLPVGVDCEPGLYQACHACRQRYEPAVRERLRQQGWFDDAAGRPPLAAIPRLAGDMLM